MRTCSVEGCERGAEYVVGHYFVGPRQVRVWGCQSHYLLVENPLAEVPTPVSIIAALVAEEERIAKAERIDRSRVIDLDQRSVHAFQSAGIGDPVPYDRVASFRWGA